MSEIHKYWFAKTNRKATSVEFDIDTMNSTELSDDTLILSPYIHYPNIPNGYPSINVTTESVDSFSLIPNEKNNQIYPITARYNDLFYAFITGFSYTTDSAVHVDKIQIEITDDYNNSQLLYLGDLLASASLQITLLASMNSCRRLQGASDNEFILSEKTITATSDLTFIKQTYEDYSVPDKFLVAMCIGDNLDKWFNLKVTYYDNHWPDTTLGSYSLRFNLYVMDELGTFIDYKVVPEENYYDYKGDTVLLYFNTKAANLNTNITLIDAYNFGDPSKTYSSNSVPLSIESHNCLPTKIDYDIIKADPDRYKYLVDGTYLYTEDNLKFGINTYINHSSGIFYDENNHIYDKYTKVLLDSSKLYFVIKLTPSSGEAFSVGTNAAFLYSLKVTLNSFLRAESDIEKDAFIFIHSVYDETQSDLLENLGRNGDAFILISFNDIKETLTKASLSNLSIKRPEAPILSVSVRFSYDSESEATLKNGLDNIDFYGESFQVAGVENQFTYTVSTSNTKSISNKSDYCVIPQFNLIGLNRVTNETEYTPYGLNYNAGAYSIEPCNIFTSTNYVSSVFHNPEIFEDTHKTSTSNNPTSLDSYGTNLRKLKNNLCNNLSITVPPGIYYAAAIIASSEFSSTDPYQLFITIQDSETLKSQELKFANGWYLSELNTDNFPKRAAREGIIIYAPNEFTITTISSKADTYILDIGLYLVDQSISCISNIHISDWVRDKRELSIVRNATETSAYYYVTPQLCWTYFENPSKDSVCFRQYYESYNYGAHAYQMKLASWRYHRNDTADSNTAVLDTNNITCLLSQTVTYRRINYAEN